MTNPLPGLSLLGAVTAAVARGGIPTAGGGTFAVEVEVEGTGVVEDLSFLPFAVGAAEPDAEADGAGSLLRLSDDIFLKVFIQRDCAGRAIDLDECRSG